MRKGILSQRSWEKARDQLAEKSKLGSYDYKAKKTELGMELGWLSISIACTNEALGSNSSTA